MIAKTGISLFRDCTAVERQMPAVPLLPELQHVWFCGSFLLGCAAIWPLPARLQHMFEALAKPRVEVVAISICRFRS